MSDAVNRPADADESEHTASQEEASETPPNGDAEAASDGESGSGTLAQQPTRTTGEVIAGQARARRRRHRRRRRVTIAAASTLIGLLVLVAAAPTLISATSLRQTVLDRIVAPHKCEATAASMSIGWFAPTKLTDLRLQRTDDRFTLEADRFDFTKTLAGYLFDPTDVGSIHVDNAHLHFHATGEGLEVPQQLPEASARFRNTRLTVTTPETETPLVDLAELDFVADLLTRGDQREIVVRSGKVLKHYPLTRELCDQGLGLIAPLLADAADLNGEASLRLDALRMEIMDETPLPEIREMRGSLEMHHASSEAGPVLASILTIIGNVLKRDVPTRVLVMQDSTIEFHVSEERVHHSGFAFVLPEVSPDLILRTDGSVGLDETLNLKISVTVPASLTREIPWLAELTSAPIEVQVTGTFDDPVVGLPDNQNLLDAVASRLAPTPDPEALPLAILRVVGGISKLEQDEPAEDLTGSIFGLIRSISATAEKNKEEQAGDEPDGDSSADGDTRAGRAPGR